MKRRQLLKRGAIAGAAGLTGVVAYDHVTDGSSPDDEGQGGEGSGDGGSEGAWDEPATPPVEQPPVRYADEFETVVDAVESGVDTAGEVPINGFIERNAADDTLLSFASGTYLLSPINLVGYDNLGVAAAHEERPTFVAPADSCTNTDPHIQFDDVSDFLLEGVDFDFRREGAGGAINVIASGDATVRNVTARGTCRTQVAMFRMDIRNPDGTGLVENLQISDDQSSTWMTGAYVGQKHSGTVTFRDCDFGEFTDNGLYGSAPGTEDGGGGTVHTEASEYRNNNVSNIRLGTPGSTSRGDTIVVESAPVAKRLNLRGIRFRRGADQVVEDCDIRFGSSVTESFAAIVYHSDNAGARVIDSHVTMDSDVIPAIRAYHYEGDADSAPIFENVTVDGEASRGAAVLIDGRDGTTFRNCTIEQQGMIRDGIRLAHSQDCELVDSRIDVTGFPLVLRDSTMTVRNTTFVTPDGERYVEEMEAEPEDFRPETWTSMAEDGTENESEGGG